MLLHPTSRTTDHLHTLGPGFQVVAIGCLRSCKLNGHIGRCELWRVEVLLVVDVDDTHNLMAAVTGNLLNHLAHLSVAYQCYFHIPYKLKRCKDSVYN